MDNLEDLYVPINTNNAHWLFLRVRFTTQTIELYDSMGLQPSNSLYLETMMHYLYADYRRRQQDEVLSFQAWS